MTKLPKLWRRKRGGKEFGAYYVEVAGKRVNLGTQDASIAHGRRREAVKGKRKFKDDIEGAADATIAAFESAPDAETPGVVEGQPAQRAPSTAREPAPAAPPLALLDVPVGADGWAEDIRGASSSSADGDDAKPPEVSDDELAQLAVDGQIWFAGWRARKVWKGFQPPTVPDAAKAPLADPWKKLFAYAGAGAMLPPWVTGAVLPLVTIAFATSTLVAAFQDMAKQQKTAAGVPDDPPPAPAPENADAAA